MSNLVIKQLFVEYLPKDTYELHITWEHSGRMNTYESIHFNQWEWTHPPHDSRMTIQEIWETLCQVQTKGQDVLEGVWNYDEETDPFLASLFYLREQWDMFPDDAFDDNYGAYPSALYLYYYDNQRRKYQVDVQ